MIGPRRDVRVAIAARASAVAITGAATSGSVMVLEEPQRFGAVADEQVLGLRIVFQHHLVRFAADAGNFVPAECRARRIQVVAVRPDAPRLNGTAHPIRAAAISSPDAGTKAVERVVGNFEGLRLVLEGGDGEDRSEDLLLEDAHLVVALEDGGFEVVAILELAVDAGAMTTGEDLGALVAADLNVVGDFLKLLGGYLRTEHRL